MKSAWFLAHARDTKLTPAARHTAWVASEREAWYEACVHRGFPLMSVPIDHIAYVRSLLVARHGSPLSGLQVRV